MMILFVFIFVTSICFHKCSCISNLTDEEYYKLPDLFALDNYEKCLSQKDGVYCLGRFDLINTQGSSSIYETLMMLTEDTLSNFNHTRIHRGLCLGSLGRCPINDSWEKSFENCVNQDMHSKYGLEVHLSKLHYCKNRDYKRQFNVIDYVFIVYTIVIVFFNLIGTAYDVLVKDCEVKGYTWLLAFSLRLNWKKLTCRRGEEHQQFNCFYGLKAILTVLVNITHANLGLLTGFIPNPRYFELAGSRPVYVIFFNGTILMQLFILMTSFLQFHKILSVSSENVTSMKLLLNAVIYRFIRISPLFMTVVALSATLYPHMGDGPLWSSSEEHAEICRHTFWRQFFILQNFYPPSCLPQAWYLSVDFQLFVITTIIMIFLQKKKENIKKRLVTVLVASLAALYVIVYALELKPMLQVSTPENLLNIYESERSFILLYQTIWGNLPSAIIGMLLSCLYVDLKTSNYDLRKSKIFVTAFHLSVPVSFLYGIAGCFCLHTMTSRPTVSLYATFDKPIYTMIMSVFILGCFVKVEGIYRRILEWPGWVVMSRLSFSSLLLHFLVAKYLVFTRLYPLNMSISNSLADGFAVSVFTFIISVPLSLMVEYPFMELYKILTKTSKTATKTSEVNGIVRDETDKVKKY